MGLKGRWCRRQPSDDEMREELEAHVAMRAEYDRLAPVVRSAALAARVDPMAARQTD